MGRRALKVGDVCPLPHVPSVIGVIESVSLVQVLASLVLVVMAVAAGAVMGLGLTRQLLIASLRAAIQLLAVGLILGTIVSADSALILAWLWVGAMVVITAAVARRRAPDLPGASQVAAVAVAATVSICLLIVFGLGIIDYRPINLIVIAGITIGNTLPSLVLGAKQVTAAATDQRGQIEALMACGMSIAQIVRNAGAPIARTAMVPQIERTNVVGLIALPGAMTGLLLGGVDPVDAVLVQLMVMYLVLGAVSLSVITTVVMGIRGLFTPSFTLISVQPSPPGEPG